MSKSDVSLDDLRGAFSVFLGADSVIGPVYLAYGHGRGRKQCGLFLYRLVLLNQAYVKERTISIKLLSVFQLPKIVKLLSLFICIPYFADRLLIYLSGG